MGPQLIQTQTAFTDCSVSVWKEPVVDSVAQARWQYRKIWSSASPQLNSSWLSWAHHEHLILTLLAAKGAKHVVQVSGLQVSPLKVELITLDAGSDFERAWLTPCKALSHETLWASEGDALKWARACLIALESIHQLGLVHGDVKADNLCVSGIAENAGVVQCLDLNSLRLIDFAYALYRDAPLQFVLPTDPVKLDYLPPFFKTALAKAQTQNNVNVINAVACANIDLFSLWYMLGKTVSLDVAKRWLHWTVFMEECCRVGETYEKKSFLSSEHQFAQPTQRLLKTVEHLLHKCGIPNHEWAVAATLVAPSAAPTPLLMDMTTQGDIELTPLLVDTVSEVIQVVNKPMRLPFLFSNAIRWLYGMLVAAFVVVDHAYVKYQLLLSDVGYYLALLTVPFLIRLSWIVVSDLFKSGPIPSANGGKSAVFVFFSVLYFNSTLVSSPEYLMVFCLSVVILFFLWTALKSDSSQKVFDHA